jgi:hypothetical protein
MPKRYKVEAVVALLDNRKVTKSEKVEEEYDQKSDAELAYDRKSKAIKDGPGRP